MNQKDIKYIFTEEDLPQKSKKWLLFRRDKLGTSEIPIIRGKFPTIWCDDYELFLRKMGKPYDTNNKYIEVGNRDEEKARQFVKDYLNLGLNSENVYDRTEGFDTKDVNFVQYTVQYKHFPSIFSSFDGIDVENKLILELKCPSENVFTKLLKNRVPKVPKMYFDQTQGQLMTAESHWGIDKGIFGVYYNEGVVFKNKKTKEERLIKLILIRTDLDVEYCEEMKEICKKYCDMIQNRKWKKNWNS